MPAVSELFHSGYMKVSEMFVQRHSCSKFEEKGGKSRPQGRAQRWKSRPQGRAQRWKQRKGKGDSVAHVLREKREIWIANTSGADW